MNVYKFFCWYKLSNLISSKSSVLLGIAPFLYFNVSILLKNSSSLLIRLSVRVNSSLCRLLQVAKSSLQCQVLIGTELLLRAT